MLRFLSLTAALSAALIPFLPEVAFGLPPVVSIEESPTVILDPINNSRTVIVNPSYRDGTVIVNPSYRDGTVIVNPSYRDRTVIVNPSYRDGTVIVNPSYRDGTVIVNPSNFNPNFQQPSCGSVIYGSPIPSPILVNPNTGLSCR